MELVCSVCGGRQADGPRCARCGDDNLLDLGQEATRDFLLDLEQRQRDRREARIRIASVALGIVTVVGLWLVPGYWSLRGKLYPGLPFLIDQWLLMILIALLATQVLGRWLPVRPRFPYLDATGQLRSPTA